jgi:hypothetical protein
MPNMAFKTVIGGRYWLLTPTLMIIIPIHRRARSRQIHRILLFLARRDEGTGSDAALLDLAISSSPLF